ncbi:hypothetical protein [Bdellovibrio svalbardensis]|uniref:General stress protein 17M-like domain-containing protein n=1 Tax=Bdellovibrio svalbardensis TaxID=2972972 RepID=A0ABT6DJT6_9BACT|nr:hypothetical protein [Bdellovibrio svalbardensis]MDG0817136.1 hypothetical protein [Bdellovibrio svalbardensis]
MIQISQLPHPDYLKYPKHHTLCFFSTEEQAQNTAEAILRQGLHEKDINIYEGAHGLNAIDSAGNQHSVKEAWARWVQKFLGTGEWDLVSEADRELREGHLLMSVLTVKEDQKDQVAELMLLNGGHSIRYIAPLYNEEMTPPSQHPS